MTYVMFLASLPTTEVSTCGAGMDYVICGLEGYVVNGQKSFCDYRCTCNQACASIMFSIHQGADLPNDTYDIREVTYYKLN